MCAEMEIKMEIQLWKEILEPYGQAVDELVVKFNHIKREYQNGRMYSPIESVSGRVKSVVTLRSNRKRIISQTVNRAVTGVIMLSHIIRFRLYTVLKSLKWKFR